VNKEKTTLETRIEAIEKKLDKLESKLDDILQNAIAKNLRVEATENLATDIDDRLMTVDDNVEFIKDAFVNMDKNSIYWLHFFCPINRKNNKQLKVESRKLKDERIKQIHQLQTHCIYLLFIFCI
jgi:hypothetical protein